MNALEGAAVNAAANAAGTQAAASTANAATADTAAAAAAEGQTEAISIGSPDPTLSEQVSTVTLPSRVYQNALLIALSLNQ
jgi:hypothetical protein